jgi:amino acid adenylation domain-containing protein
MQAHNLVAGLVEMTPTALGRVAFRWFGGAMTLADLRMRMLRLGAWLGQEAGVGKGDRVVIAMPKSPEAVVALYAVLAAGAVYSPVQHYGPPDRLNAILASTRPKAILTTRAMAGHFAAGHRADMHLVDLDAKGGGFDKLTGAIEPLTAAIDVEPEDLAWLIYTSGSTGEPKGVMLPHRAMRADIAAMQARYPMSGQDLRISHAPMHYISAFDLLFPLVSDVCIYLLPEKEAMFPERVTAVMERERATIWSSSATALRLLLERGKLEGRDLSALRRIAFYGEAMPMPALRQIMAALPHADFVNHYGATELDMIATFAVPRPLPEEMPRLPLGSPPGGVAVTLRDGAGKVVADGEIGEICADGPGAAMGYWDDPVLSASKRLPGIANSYRTGDLAYRRDGILYAVGRMDQMVKIRGHRLDLGEVEAVLRLHPLVADALAIAAGEPDLDVRAVVLSRGGPDLLAELHQLCRRHLPSHGRPARIIVLAEFPQLATGKVDRQALRRLLEA